MVELSEIVNGLRTQGGFHLYAHGQGRDFKDQGDLYTVAVHNLDDPCVASRAVREYAGDKVGSFIIENRTFLDFDLSNLVLYGSLSQRVVRKVGERKIPVHRFIARTGFFGPLLDEMLGPRSVEVEEIEDVQGVFYEGSKPLKTFLESNDENAAHFLELPLRTRLGDSSGRVCPPPYLIIITNKAKVDEIILYLKQNPQDYLRFMRGLFPKDQYPASNFILDNTKNPESLKFLDLDKINRDIDRLYIPQLYERFGEASI